MGALAAVAALGAARAAAVAALGAVGAAASSDLTPVTTPVLYCDRFYTNNLPISSGHSAMNLLSCENFDSANWALGPAELILRP